MTIEDQPPPTTRPDLVPVWDIVIEDVASKPDPACSCNGCASWRNVADDMRARDSVGRERYGTPLTTGNGRDHLVDAYQEALDLVVYLRTESLEPASKIYPERLRIAYEQAVAMAHSIRIMIDERARET